ncbi:MAG: hypothetical protein Q7T11_05120, partial [Deltaproteobacteria bacterium]|nr:hypothetical protein [Deltaproteobacteria bacterium]
MAEPSPPIKRASSPSTNVVEDPSFPLDPPAPASEGETITAGSLQESAEKLQQVVYARKPKASPPLKTTPLRDALRQACELFLKDEPSDNFDENLALAYRYIDNYLLINKHGSEPGSHAQQAAKKFLVEMLADESV